MARVDGAWASTLAVEDRGLLYGDGVFRTLRMVAGQACWLDEQLERLAADARRIGIEPPEDALWREDIAALAARMPDAAVRLTLTRGLAVRGYLPAPGMRPCRIAFAFPLPEAPPDVHRQGICLRLCRLRLGAQPALAGIKHLNRLENVIARMEWADTAIHEGILLDHSGRVVSAVSANLFILHAGELLTPRLDYCGVAGAARARFMRIAAASGWRVRETDFGLAELWAAQSVLLTNSLIRLRWAAACDGRSWKRPEAFDAWLEAMDAQ